MKKLTFILCMQIVYMYAFGNFEKEIVIVTASYNNKQWYERNVLSVFAQKYTNYRLIYIDDCSTDGTYEGVAELIKEMNKEDRVMLIRNSKRCGALANHYHAIYMCNDSAIIVILDGDDWLAHPNVLSYINHVYADESVWVTYGQFREYPHPGSGCCEIPAHIIKQNTFRKDAWYPYFPSHLRTFYAGLFKQINKEDLMYEGDFFRMNADIAVMFPLIEMAHEGHIKFIPDILLIYNMVNPLNDHKVSKPMQHNLHMYIRSMQPYQAVASPFKKNEGIS